MHKCELKLLARIDMVRRVDIRQNVTLQKFNYCKIWLERRTVV